MSTLHEMLDEIIDSPERRADELASLLVTVQVTILVAGGYSIRPALMKATEINEVMSESMKRRAAQRKADRASKTE